MEAASHKITAGQQISTGQKRVLMSRPLPHLSSVRCFRKVLQYIQPLVFSKNFRNAGPAFLSFLLILIMSSAGAVAQTSAERPNAVMIIDASRSMWGQIDGVNKIVSVHRAIGDVVVPYNKRMDLGLVAYGHRKSSGCNDIEVLSPLTALDASKYQKLVKSIKPKGSTPIASALNRAATTLQKVKGPATILLVSDGLDNCRGNPCEVARSLKSKYSNLKIDVVAFDRQEQEKLKSLSCVASETGGTFQSAVNESQLKSAVKNSLDAQFLLTSVTQPQTVRQQPETTASQTWQPVTSNQEQQVARKDAITGFETQTRAGEREPARKPLKPGQKNTTQLRLQALVIEGGRPIKSGLIWRIFSGSPDSKGRYTLLSTHRDAQPDLNLKPGNYLVNAAYGRAYLTQKVTVEKNKPFAETFVLNSGGLRLNSVLANGQRVSANSVTYTIYSDERDQFGNRKRILGGARPNLIIRLNAGIYHVVSRYGDANAIVSSDVTVEPGKLTEATVNHSGAKVTFKLVFKPGGEAIANTQWSIMTPQGDVIKESAGALPTHILAAGSYHVLARHNGQNYKREFNVVAGSNSNIEVVVQ